MSITTRSMFRFRFIVEVYLRFPLLDDDLGQICNFFGTVISKLANGYTNFRLLEPYERW